MTRTTRPDVPISTLLREFLSCEEAADLVRCSTRSIRRRVADGLLPAARTAPGRGGRFLLRRIDVLRCYGLIADEVRA